jgi:hypothetical protein
MKSALPVLALIGLFAFMPVLSIADTPIATLPKQTPSDDLETIRKDKMDIQAYQYLIQSLIDGNNGKKIEAILQQGQLETVLNVPIQRSETKNKKDSEVKNLFHYILHNSKVFYHVTSITVRKSNQSNFLIIPNDNNGMPQKESWIQYPLKTGDDISDFLNKRLNKINSEIVADIEDSLQHDNLSLKSIHNTKADHNALRKHFRDEIDHLRGEITYLTPKESSHKSVFCELAKSNAAMYTSLGAVFSAENGSSHVKTPVAVAAGLVTLAEVLGKCL